MADNSKVVINLATGLEDAERVTVAFLVGGAAAEQGKQLTMFLTKDAVRLALPGHADAVACDGCPPLARLFEQYAASGGQLLVWPICFQALTRPCKQHRDPLDDHATPPRSRICGHASFM